MKIGVIKIGSRISFNSRDTSGGNGEARSVIKMLKKGGLDVVIFTDIKSSDNLVEDYEWRDINFRHDDTADIDALVVLNGNLQFFGGAEDSAQITNYKMINRFKSQIFYIYCDPDLTLKQPGGVFTPSKAAWNHKYTKDELFITRTDIIYLSQPYDIEKVLAKPGKNEIVPKKIIHFPFEQFPCLNERIGFNEKPEVHLSYGGTMRGNKRIEKMIKFYFGYPEDIKVEMFGKIKADNFPTEDVSTHPMFGDAVKYNEMLPKMNTAMSHVVIGDKYYEKINDMAQRAYESIWSSVVTFIDSDLDTHRRVYGDNKSLSDFLYVKSKDEVIDKIRSIKDDRAAREEVAWLQFAAINFSSKGYCENFTSIIKEHS